MWTDDSKSRYEKENQVAGLIGNDSLQTTSSFF